MCKKIITAEYGLDDSKTPAPIDAAKTSSVTLYPAVEPDLSWFSSAISQNYGGGVVWSVLPYRNLFKEEVLELPVYAHYTMGISKFEVWVEIPDGTLYEFIDANDRFDGLQIARSGQEARGGSAATDIYSLDMEQVSSPMSYHVITGLQKCNPGIDCDQSLVTQNKQAELFRMRIRIKDNTGQSFPFRAIVKELRTRSPNGATLNVHQNGHKFWPVATVSRDGVRQGIPDNVAQFPDSVNGFSAFDKCDDGSNDNGINGISPSQVDEFCATPVMRSVKADEAVAVLAYTERPEIINTAILDGRKIETGIKVFEILSKNDGDTLKPDIKEVAVGTSGLQCAIDEAGVASVSANCVGGISLTGNEQKGSSSLGVRVSYKGFSVSSRMRIWVPSLQLTLEAPGSLKDAEDQDRVMISKISGWEQSTASGCTSTFQSRTLAASTTFSDGDSTFKADVMPYVQNLLESDQPATVKVEGTTVRGLSEGATEIRIRSPRGAVPLAKMKIRVGGEVSVRGLDVVTVKSLAVETTCNGGAVVDDKCNLPGNAFDVVQTVTTKYESVLLDSSERADIQVHALFSDGTWLELHPADGLDVRSLTDALAITNPTQNKFQVQALRSTGSLGSEHIEVSLASQQCSTGVIAKQKATVAAVLNDNAPIPTHVGGRSVFSGVTEGTIGIEVDIGTFKGVDFDNGNMPVFVNPCESELGLRSDPIFHRVLGVRAVGPDGNDVTLPASREASLKNSFIYHEATGKLSMRAQDTKNTIDREEIASVVVELGASNSKISDSATNQTSGIGAATITVNIIDINDNKPVFAAHQDQAYVLFGMETSSPLMQLKASDDDEGDNANIEFRIVPQPSDPKGWVYNCDGTLPSQPIQTVLFDIAASGPNKGSLITTQAARYFSPQGGATDTLAVQHTVTVAASNGNGKYAGGLSDINPIKTVKVNFFRDEVLALMTIKLTPAELGQSLMDVNSGGTTGMDELAQHLSGKLFDGAKNYYVYIVSAAPVQDVTTCKDSSTPVTRKRRSVASCQDIVPQSDCHLYTTLTFAAVSGVLSSNTPPDQATQAQIKDAIEGGQGPSKVDALTHQNIIAKLMKTGSVGAPITSNLKLTGRSRPIAVQYIKGALVQGSYRDRVLNAPLDHIVGVNSTARLTKVALADPPANSLETLSAEQSTSSSDNNVGLIVGVCVAAVFTIVAVGAIVVFQQRKQHGEKQAVRHMLNARKGIEPTGFRSSEMALQQDRPSFSFSGGEVDPKQEMPSFTKRQSSNRRSTLLSWAAAEIMLDYQARRRRSSRMRKNGS
jgi:hypothetical protein